ncbi:hypothetical protein Clim_1037 [Chlorobium limicola DSM 245]|uniref:Apea-like HEPN domain-containing protein n=1 Tax=Chlorobium limicola (strain DSM 245 / NBRC 103803 / 6330) TaxID=290315 RepID=B3EC37_CHLL2|nr:hypothetical protein [Chlorobium limicola]ACD90112.1 hypothetical protein Clim_1037 [Chlorobium limicola DSM 245]
MDSFNTRSFSALIHIPRLDIEDENLELMSGNLIRPDPRMIYDLDEDWIRESFLEKSRPIFFLYNHTELSKKSEFAQRSSYAHILYKLQQKVDIFIFVLVSVTGAELISTCNSTSYIIDVDMSLISAHVGQFGRNLINHNPAPIKISDEYIKLAIQISILWSQYFEQKKIDVNLLSGFYALESLCFSSLYPVFKCLPIVTSLENLLIPDVKSGIQKALQNEVTVVLGESACEEDMILIKRAYNLRSRIIHGDSKKILNNDDFRDIYHEMRILFGKVLLMRISNKISSLVNHA